MFGFDFAYGDFWLTFDRIENKNIDSTPPPSRSIPITPVLNLTRLGHVVPEFLHIPGGSGAAFGAEAAVQADVLVLDHDAFRLGQSLGNVEVLRQVERGHFCA